MEIRKIYEETINKLTQSDIDAIEEDGILPTKLDNIITVDPITGLFVAKDYPDIVIGNVNDIIDAVYYKEILDSEESAIN